MASEVYRVLYLLDEAGYDDDDLRRPRLFRLVPASSVSPAASAGADPALLSSYGIHVRSLPRPGPAAAPAPLPSPPARPPDLLGPPGRPAGLPGPPASPCRSWSRSQSSRSWSRPRWSAAAAPAPLPANPPSWLVRRPRPLREPAGLSAQSANPPSLPASPGELASPLRGPYPEMAAPASPGELASPLPPGFRWELARLVEARRSARLVVARRSAEELARWQTLNGPYGLATLLELWLLHVLDCEDAKIAKMRRACPDREDEGPGELASPPPAPTPRAGQSRAASQSARKCEDGGTGSAGSAQSANPRAGQSRARSAPAAAPLRAWAAGPGAELVLPAGEPAAAAAPADMVALARSLHGRSLRIVVSEVRFGWAINKLGGVYVKMIVPPGAIESVDGGTVVEGYLEAHITLMTLPPQCNDQRLPEFLEQLHIRLHKQTKQWRPSNWSGAFAWVDGSYDRDGNYAWAWIRVESRLHRACHGMAATAIHVFGHKLVEKWVLNLKFHLSFYGGGPRLSEIAL